MQQDQGQSDTASAAASWRSAGLFAVRYGIGAIMIVAGLVVLVAVGGDLGAYGFASAVGAGLSVMLLNFLFRMSVSSDRDREREEEARRYFGERGVWPDDEEAEERLPRRRWTLARGVVTAEQEEHERRFADGGEVPTTV
jgi:hypothetical protein